MTIRNPVEWSFDHLGGAVSSLGETRRTLRRPATEFDDTVPTIRRIGPADLAAALREGFQDFVACRSDVLAIGVIYPLAGLLLAQIALDASLAPLLFPLVAGFALLGPLAAIGLYESSRRLEQGEEVSWSNVADAFASPSGGAILGLGLILTGVFLAWLAVAMAIFAMTMGTTLPTSLAAFARDVLTTPGGWAMIVLGVGVGAFFAIGVLAISVVSFPLLLDRKARISLAIRTSIRAVTENPVTMLLWGLIVAGGLALGALPLLLGLIVVVPVLGHATWRLYRRVVG